jgi:hypothetical protein
MDSILSKGKLGHGLTQMNTDFQDVKFKELTERIIKIFYKVYNTLARPTRLSELCK